MIDNTAFKIATSKLAGISPVVPGTLFLIGGIVIWRLWRKQSELQAQTSQLSRQLNHIRKQVTDIKETTKSDSGSAAALSSSLKKMTSFWSSKK